MSKLIMNRLLIFCLITAAASTSFANGDPIDVEPGGLPAIINYNVPEPTIIYGRSNLPIAIPYEFYKDDAFRHATAEEAITGAAVRSLADECKKPEKLDEAFILKVKAAMMNGFTDECFFPTSKMWPNPIHLVVYSDNGQGMSVQSSGAELDTALKNLTPTEAATLIWNCKTINVRRSAFETLYYEQIPLDIARCRHFIPKADYPVSTAIEPETLTITIPSNGLIVGPARGIPLELTGEVNDESRDPIDNVQVKIDDGAFKDAVPFERNNFHHWRFSHFLTSPGKHTVTVRSLHRGAVKEIATAEVEAAFAAETTTAAVSPPKIQIISPLNGTKLTGPKDGIAVKIQGETSAQTSISSVRVRIDDAEFVDAVPVSPGDWSKWSFDFVTKETGRHIVTARAIDSTGQLAQSRINLKSEITGPLKQLTIIEHFRISSFLTNYGAGRTLKTFTLLPGEKTKISIDTYKSHEETSKRATSFLDSFSSESAIELQNQVTAEEGSKSTVQQAISGKVHFEGEIEANASIAGVGGGTSIKTGVELAGSLSASREDAYKKVATSMEKQAHKSSHKRDIKIDTETTTTEKSIEKNITERQIENINVGRTLNFVFRQMNQEFLSLVHLVDVTIQYVRADIDANKEVRETRVEVALPQLDSLLEEAIEPSKVRLVRKSIVHALKSIIDYRRIPPDEPYVEEIKLPDKSRYLRWRSEKMQKYVEWSPGKKHKTIEKEVPGIILASQKNVMRTDGIMVESVLGQSPALDKYSDNLQLESIRVGCCRFD